MSIRSLILALLVATPLGFLHVSASELPDDRTDPRVADPSAPVVIDGQEYVPLRRDTPASYTDAIHRKVLAASAKGMLYDAENDREVPVAANFLFIRPGAWMWSPSWCTLNFVYGTAGSYKIGSAGHCNWVGSQVVIVAYPGVFANIGTTTASRNFGPGDDWSLISIYPQFQGNVDANVADIWGPQGGAHPGGFALTTGAMPAKHFGHGLGIGTGGTPRAGVAVAAIGCKVWFEGAIAPGDSGGPLLIVTSQHPLGQALAVITHLAPGPIQTGFGTLVACVPATVKDGDLNPLPPA